MLYAWSRPEAGSTDDPRFDGYLAREERGVADVSAKRELHYTKAAVGVVLSGCFDYCAPNGSTTAVPGTVIFGNPSEQFSVSHLGPIGNHRIVAWFDAGFLENVASEWGLDSVRFEAAAMPPGKGSTRLFSRLQAMVLRGDEEAACALAATALTTRRQRPAADFVSGVDRKRILAVVRHIETAYAEPCTIEALAAVSGFGRFRFMRAFRAVTGQSVNQLLLAKRLRAAASRLVCSQAPIGEIALEVGFNDLSHFNTAFRAAFATSPRQLRRGMASAS